MTLRRLVLWRHGETDYNAGLRMQGQLDSQLTVRGAEQVRRAAPLVAALGGEALVSSDLGRATDTAKALVEHTGLALHLDRRLRETHLGEWQGLTHDEVERGWPGGMEQWRTHPTWAPAGGETRIEVAERAGRVVAELDAGTHDAGEHETVVLCAHGGLIAGLTPWLLGIPAGHWPSFAGITNCHWTVLGRRGGQWRLAAYNTAAQL